MKNKIVLSYRFIILVYYLLAFLIVIININHLERVLIYSLILIVLFGIVVHIYILNIPKLLLSNKYIEKNLSTVKEAIDKIHNKSINDSLITIYIFLLEISNYKEEYQNFVEQNSKRIFDEKQNRHWYTIKLQYYYNLNEKDEYKYIQEYAIKHNLKIVSVGYHHEWCKSINASPIELLGWIKNASLVVTDTFHGSVMSIICNTPMAVKLRGNKNKLEFLLSEYGLKHRTMEAFDKLETVASEDIDFNMVNDVITERRQSSMQFLDGALEKCQ